VALKSQRRPRTAPSWYARGEQLQIAAASSTTCTTGGARRSGSTTTRETVTEFAQVIADATSEHDPAAVLARHTVARIASAYGVVVG
jgi:hypothetical protein